MKERPGSEHAGILIIGGGLVGACMANLLARERALAGQGVVLVESRLPERPLPGADIDQRVSAVSRATERILTACGVWDSLDPAFIAPYERMCVWDEAGKPDGPGSIHFDCADIGEPNLGYIVENRHVQCALLDSAREAGVRIENSLLQSLNLDGGGGVLVELANGRRIDAQLIIAADGVDSPTRRALGIPMSDTTLGHAIVAHVRTRESHQRTAWQRFLSTGPIAFLPLPDGRSSIVWSTTEAIAHELLAQPEEGFRQAVEAASDAVLGSIESCGPRVGFPLRSGHANRYTAPHCALIGDAAHAVHPLAGQGVNLGFLDCAVLAEVLVEAHARGEHPGDQRVLRRYERCRKGENLAMLAALEGLNGLFSSEGVTLGLARRLGLTMVDRLAPVKHFFMRRALGLQGDSPGWVRAEAGNGEAR